MQSTTTLLEAANRILLFANERPLANLSSPLGQQVRLALTTALVQFTEAEDWTWLSQRVNADAWNADAATLASNVIVVRRMTYNNGWHDMEIPQVDRITYDQFPNYAGTRPLMWTQDLGFYRVHPYPTTLAEQAAIWFHVKIGIDLPTSESGVFAMPERALTPLVLLAASLFAMQHVEDQGLYTTLRGEYELLMQQFRNTQGRSTNMYPRYKMRTYGRKF